MPSRKPPRAFRLRAVLFDFDGTLTHPGALDFAAFKREIACPADHFVLEWIEALPAGRARDEALAALERFELSGAAASLPNEGAEELVSRLRAAGLQSRRAHAQRPRRRGRGAGEIHQPHGCGPATWW